MFCIGRSHQLRQWRLCWAGRWAVALGVSGRNPWGHLLWHWYPLLCWAKVKFFLSLTSLSALSPSAHGQRLCTGQPVPEERDKQMSSTRLKVKEDMYVTSVQGLGSSNLMKAPLLNLLDAIDNQSRYLGGGHRSKVSQGGLLNTIHPFRFPWN